MILLNSLIGSSEERKLGKFDQIGMASKLGSQDVDVQAL